MSQQSNGSPPRVHVIAPPPVLFVGTLVAGLLVDFLVYRLHTGLAETLRFALGGVASLIGSARRRTSRRW